MPTVTKVRTELSSDGSHRHIEGVCTSDGTHYTRSQVVDGINAGEVWVTSAEGQSATIETLTYCPASACLATPYITTRRDSTAVDNLDNLPTC
jgi:hypothetical protein